MGAEKLSDWRNNDQLKLLNLMYDVTPMECILVHYQHSVRPPSGGIPGTRKISGCASNASFTDALANWYLGQDLAELLLPVELVSN